MGLVQGLASVDRLREEIRDVRYREATTTFCRLMTEQSRSMRDMIQAAIASAAPFVQVPSHLMRLPNGELRGVNYDHTILGWRGARFAPGARLALALGAVVYVLEPNVLQTGSFVDLRVGLILGCLLFAGVQPRVASRDALVCGVVIAALIGGRVGDIALGWVHHRIDLADVRGAIAQVPQGARVLVAQGPGGGPAVAERLLPGVYATDGHVSALLAIEHKAFWPLIFADPRQQPLAILPPYASLAAPLSEPVGWSALAKSSFSADDLAAVGNLNGWRQAFDYVLLVDAEGAGPPPAGLQPLYVGSYARLYRTPRRM